VWVVASQGFVVEAVGHAEYCVAKSSCLSSLVQGRCRCPRGQVESCPQVLVLYYLKSAEIGVTCAAGPRRRGIRENWLYVRMRWQAGLL